MPPTPLKTHNVRHAVYKKSQNKIATVPKNAEPISPLSPSSPLSRLSPLGNPATDPPCIIDFGVHKGKLLADAPNSWISWVKGKILNGGFEESRYDELRKSLREWIDLEAPFETGTLEGDYEWEPPPLGFAPSRFHEDRTCQPLTISGIEVRQYFKLADSILENFPTLGGIHDILLPSDKKRYYLLHVYDWVKTYSSKTEAETALDKFLLRNDPEVYGMLGYGISEYHW